MNCPFCNLNSLRARLIYRDRSVVAFPTNIPITPGHVILCPLRHVARIEDLRENEWVDLRAAIIKIKSALKKSVAATGFNLAWNEGRSAGQSIGHLHLHIVPRHPGDTGIYKYEPRQFLYRPGTRLKSPSAELRAVALLIKKNLSK